MNKISLM